MVNILLVTHAPLGEALIHCAGHIFGHRPDGVVAVDVIADTEPQALGRQLQDLLTSLDAGEGVLILTDMMGSTPSNIASNIAQAHHATVITGVSLPMLIRTLSYRHETLEALVEKALVGGHNAILHQSNKAHD